MIDAHIRILCGRRGLHRVAQGLARAIGIAAQQEAHHVDDIGFGSGQPILHGQEIGPHILRLARDQPQDLRQAAQHGHLLGARAGIHALGVGLAAQLLDQRQRPGLGLVHAEGAQPRQAHQFCGRHGHHHCIAMLAPCFQRRLDGADLVFQKHHRDNDNVGGRNVGLATVKRGGIVLPFGRGMQGQGQAGNLLRQDGLCLRHHAGQMLVQRDEDDPDGRLLSAHSVTSRHTMCPGRSRQRRVPPHISRCCAGPCRARRRESSSAPAPHHWPRPAGPAPAC